MDEASYNGVASDQSVNSNIAAINSTLGDLASLTSSSNFTSGQSVADDKSNMPRTVVAALNSIDRIIGNSTISYEGIDGENTKANYSMPSGSSITDAVSHVASHIGTANFNTQQVVKYDDDGRITQNDDGSIAYTEGYINGVSDTNTVNANIATLNANIGDVESLRHMMYASNKDEEGNVVKTSVTDAVYNLDQHIDNLYTQTSKIAYNVNDLQYRYKKLRKDFQTGMASMAAMSALAPNARASGDTQLSVGTGAYAGHTAAAVGAYHWLTDNLMFNIGAAWGDSSDKIYRLGVTYSW